MTASHLLLLWLPATWNSLAITLSYLREWKQKQETFLSFAAKDVDYGCSLLAAFQVSYDCLSTSASAPVCFLAPIAPQPFPRTPLENSEFLQMTISADIRCRAGGVANAFTADNRRGITIVAQARARLHANDYACPECCDSLLLASVCVELMLPSPEWNDVGWRLWERLATHVRTLLDRLEGYQLDFSATGMIYGFGLWLFHRAQYAEAESLMRRVLAIDDKSDGPEDPKIALDLNNLAQLLQATNRLWKAEPLMRRALAIDEMHFGPEHPRVATDLNNLAQLFQATSRHCEAEPLMWRALAIDEKTEDPKVAIHLNNLAQLFQADEPALRS